MPSRSIGAMTAAAAGRAVTGGAIRMAAGWAGASLAATF